MVYSPDYSINGVNFLWVFLFDNDYQWKFNPLSFLIFVFTALRYGILFSLLMDVQMDFWVSNSSLLMLV